MAHQYIFLKSSGVFLGYSHITEGAETGGNSVNSFLVLHPSINEMAAFSNLLFCVGGQLNLGAFSGDGNQFLQGHPFHTEKYSFHRIGLAFTSGWFDPLSPFACLPVKKNQTLFLFQRAQPAQLTKPANLKP